MLKLKYIIFFIFLSIGICISAQNTGTTIDGKDSKKSSEEELLAAQYYQNQEYTKAIEIYKNLYDKTKNTYYYEPYLECLIHLKDFKAAIKLIKKQQKQSNNLRYRVDLGFVYDLDNQREKANEIFNDAIKQVNVYSEQNVIDLANNFIHRDKTDFAIQTYLYARKKSKNIYAEYLAEIYYKKNKLKLMMDEYIFILKNNPFNAPNIKTILQDRINNASTQQEVIFYKNYLLQVGQNNINDIVINDMIIFLYVQLNDFESAWILAKALDKRYEYAEELLELAEIAHTNYKYSIAEDIYHYIIKKGNKNPYYIDAKIALLNALNKKIIIGNYTQDDIHKLEKNYIKTIDELGINTETGVLLVKLAELNAYYLHRADSAILLLDKAIEIPHISAQFRAKCKIKTADVLLIRDDYWDAKLYYGQVEKEFKHDLLGQEAKFKNAKLSYYMGEFDWAKAQLDVLKAATSKFIANDAMQLSLTITDNTVLDTTHTPLLMFAQADLLLYQNQNKQAIKKLDSIILFFPNHSLEDDILYKKAKLYQKSKQYLQAISLYDSIYQYYKQDILADDAFYNAAKIYDYKLNNPQKAMEYYKEFMINFPGSIYTTEARKRFRFLRGDIN